jgi:hypothetical protein
MTEQGNANKYISCSRYKMKYHNNGESIKAHFGFTRLGERLKTCTKYRAKRHAKQQEPHRKKYNKRYYEECKEHNNAISKEWRDKNKGYLAEQLECELCGSFVSRDNMQRHARTLRCKDFTQETHNDEKCNELTTHLHHE